MQTKTRPGTRGELSGTPKKPWPIPTEKEQRTLEAERTKRRWIGDTASVNRTNNDQARIRSGPTDTRSATPCTGKAQGASNGPKQQSNCSQGCPIYGRNGYLNSSDRTQGKRRMGYWGDVRVCGVGAINMHRRRTTTTMSQTRSPTRHPPQPPYSDACQRSTSWRLGPIGR